MRLFFEVFKQRTKVSKTTAASAAAVLILVGVILHARNAPTVPVADAIASKPLSGAIANKRVSDAFATMATEPVGNAVATKPEGDAFATKPTSDSTATKPVAGATTAKPVSDPTATKPKGEAFATKRASDAIATTPASDTIAAKPGETVGNKHVSDAIANKKATPISQTALANEWQDWQYCLAPSHAEHRIYLSAPVPKIGIVRSADAVFHEMLNKAGIPHDEVQCPMAPNKRTLLFRQRYAIRLNEEIGNATVTLNWEPDVD
jgi:hypothetical protein